MRSQSKSGTFATTIDIQQVEVFLTNEDLHYLLSGKSLSCLHKDSTSPAKFHIILTPEINERTERC